MFFEEKSKKCYIIYVSYLSYKHFKNKLIMKKNFNEVIKNLKCEIINSIIEEFETYNKNEVDLWRFDVDDEVRENEIINEWSKLTQNYFDGTTCIANKFYKNDKNQYVIYYEVENENGDEINTVEIDIANYDYISADVYCTLYNLLSDDDVKKANMNNKD